MLALQGWRRPGMKRAPSLREEVGRIPAGTPERTGRYRHPSSSSSPFVIAVNGSGRADVHHFRDFWCHPLFAFVTWKSRATMKASHFPLSKAAGVLVTLF